MSNGIDKNPLLDISKVYLKQISENKDDSYLEPDIKKRQKNNEKARKELAKGPQMKNPHFEEKQQGWDSVNSLADVYKEMHEVEDVSEADSLAAMAARREKRLVAQRKKMGKTAGGNDFGHDYGATAEVRKKRQDADYQAAFGRKPTPKKESYDPMDDPDFDHDEAEKNRGVSGKNNPKGGKVVGKQKKMKEALDPVGQEDADVDNDGDVDKSDKYLGKRRKAIAKAMKKKMSEDYKVLPKEKMARQSNKAYDKEQSAVSAGDEKETNKQMQRRIAMQNPAGRKAQLAKVKTESFSNWRNDLIEVAPTGDDEETKIKEKKINNKITLNPKLGEEVVSELGGTMIEMVEYDEFDGMVEGVYFELHEEGYAEDAIEEALEWVLTEAKVTYGSDTESPKQQMMKKAKGRLRFLGRKIGGKMSSAKKKAGMKSAQAQVAAYNKAREAKQSASDIANRVKKSAIDTSKNAKKGLKSKIKSAAEKIADRMSEEIESDPKEKQMLAKKRQMMMKQQMLDKQRMQAQQQGKLPSGHRIEQKEEMTAFEKVKADIIKKHGKNAIVGAPKNKVDHAKINAAKASARKPNKREQESSGRYTGGYAGD